MRSACFGAAGLLIMLLSACSTASGAITPESTGIAPDGPDADVRNFQLRALESRLPTIPPGVERDYFTGILASRLGRTEESIRLLSRVLPELREAQRGERAANALEALADAYTTSYRYREASQAYDELEQHFARNLKEDVADDAALARMLITAPAQSVEREGPVRLRTSRNPIGSLMSELTVNGIREQWLLDTGANQTVVSRNFAERLGLTPLRGVASVGSGVTGLKSALQAAVLPALRVGGATVKNVIVVIVDDADLRIGSRTNAYQINAVLGYPVLRALEKVTFTHEGEFLAGESAENTTGVPMYMRRLTPAIECEVEGERLLFTFDTGASSTDLSVRYYELFRRQERTWRTRIVESGGAGGSIKQKMFIQPTVKLKIGDESVTLKNVPIFSVRTNAGIDFLFGNVGQDFVADFRSFTLDFLNMRFGLGAPLSSHLHN